jgi:hypothetical protein
MFQFSYFFFENNIISCRLYEPTVVSHDADICRDCDILFCNSVFRRARNAAERLLNSHRPPTRPLISACTSETEQNEFSRN